MKITYRMTRQDYLNSVTLRQALNRQGFMIARVIGLLAIASGVYLSAAALTGTTGTEHPLPYVIAVLATIFYLVVTDSRLLPALLFKYKLKSKDIPDGMIGIHELELLPNYLDIRYGGHQFRFRYPAVAGVTSHKQNIMLFTTTGLVEVIPNEAFIWGVSKQDFLEELDERVKTFEAQKIDTPVKGFTDFEQMETADQAILDFSDEDVLHSSLLHNHQTRRQNLSDAIKLVWLTIAVFVLAGSVKGLLDYAMKRVELPSFMIVISYVVCLVVAILGIIRIWMPDSLALRNARQALAAKRYPEGYVGRRTIRWNEEAVQYAYGFIAGCLTWTALSELVADREGFYLYQGSNMIMAIPIKSFTAEQRQSFENAAAAMLKRV